MKHWRDELRLRVDGSVQCRPHNMCLILANDPRFAWALEGPMPDHEQRWQIRRMFDRHYGWRRMPLQLTAAIAIVRSERASGRKRAA